MKAVLGMTREEFSDNRHALPASAVAKLLGVTEKTIMAWAERRGLPANPRTGERKTFDWPKVLDWYTEQQRASAQRCHTCGR